MNDWEGVHKGEGANKGMGRLWGEDFDNRREDQSLKIMKTESKIILTGLSTRASPLIITNKITFPTFSFMTGSLKNIIKKKQTKSNTTIMPPTMH
jgi:hypothetical protein